MLVKKKVKPSKQIKFEAGKAVRKAWKGFRAEEVLFQVQGRELVNDYWLSSVGLL